MRKSSYFAMSLLLTALSAQAADLMGASPAVNTPGINVTTQTGVNATGTATARDVSADTSTPSSPPLESAAPTTTPSATTTTAATGSASTGGTAAGTTMRGTAGTTSTTVTTTTTTPAGAAVAPDNTRINQRDRDKQTLTPGDQANSQADISTTSAIRQALVKSDLSTTARNIKIITSNGRVTLRGPVKTVAEKTRIESLARTVAGATTVDNQLDVKATIY